MSSNNNTTATTERLLTVSNPNKELEKDQDEEEGKQQHEIRSYQTTITTKTAIKNPYKETNQFRFKQIDL